LTKELLLRVGPFFRSRLPFPPHQKAYLSKASYSVVGLDLNKDLDNKIRVLTGMV
jgi:hypothetical protein